MDVIQYNFQYTPFNIELKCKCNKKSGDKDPLLFKKQDASQENEEPCRQSQWSRQLFALLFKN